MKVIPQKQDKEIEKAIMMVVDCVREKCTNPKPLILHSIGVGFRLLELKEPREAVLAGFLHDLVEDTNCTIEQIEKEFDQEVSNLITVLTQEKIGDYKERWRVLMNKIKKADKSAMLIKLLDIENNFRYLPHVKDHEILKEIQWKHNFAMSELEPHLGDLDIFKECRRVHKELFKKLL